MGFIQFAQAFSSSVRRTAVVTLLVGASVCAQAQLASSAWPYNRGNVQNTGQGQANGARGFLNWKFRPAAPQNAVFAAGVAVGSDGTIYAGDTGGNLDAVNPDGTQKWTCSLHGVMVSSPTIAADGTIYVGSVDQNLYAVNSNGIMQWSYQAGGSLIGSVTIDAHGNLYFCAGDHMAYSLTSDGAFRWSVYTDYGDNFLESAGSPAISNDGSTVYFTSQEGILSAYSTAGVQQWTNVAGSGYGSVIVGAPAVGSDGTIYFGSYGAINAINPDGSVKWQQTIDGECNGSPSIGSDGAIYVGSGGQTFYALNPVDGSVRWSYNSPGGGGFESGSSIASSNGLPIDNGCIFTVDSRGFVYGILPGGQLGWSVPTGGFYSQTPAIGPDGSVYVAALDGYIYSFGSGSPLYSLTVSPNSVAGGAGSTGTIRLNQVVTGFDLPVGLHSDNASAIVPAYPVTVPVGSSSASFPITTSPVATTQVATISALWNNQVAPKTAKLTITSLNLQSFSVSPTSVYGTVCSAGTVTLTGPAPAGGYTFSLSSDSSAASVPATVTVLSGSTSATFKITTIAVDSDTNATIGISGHGSSSATLKVKAAVLNGLTLNPNTVVGSVPVIGTVTLNSPAGPSGAVVHLSSSDSHAQVPATVTVAAGATSANFTVVTSLLLTTANVTITATEGGQTYTANLAVNPAILGSLTMNPGVVMGGEGTTGTVGLISPAPAGGSVVFLSSNSSCVHVPASVTVPAGQKAIAFPVTTMAVTSTHSVTIVATQALHTITVTLTVTPPPLVTVSVQPTTVVGGATATGTVGLNRAANAGGYLINLSSSQSCATVPASVTVPAGASLVTFPVATTWVNSNTVVTVTATQGPVTKSAQFTVATPSVVAVSVSPTSVTGGSASTGTVTLNIAAPPAGVSVHLASNKTCVTVPATTPVPAGAISTTFSVSTVPVSYASVATITASVGGSSATAGLTVNPAALVGITVSPTSVLGGAIVQCSVTIASAAGPSGAIVSLSQSAVLANIPLTVTIPAGSTCYTFNLTTYAVTTATTGKIYATLNGVSKYASLTLTGPYLNLLSVSPSTVVGGVYSTGYFAVAGVPYGGAVVHLASSSPCVTVPATVTAQGPGGSATFIAQSYPVAQDTTVTITATYNGTSLTTTLLVTAPVLTGLTLSPNSVQGGKVSNLTATISSPAPQYGLIVYLSANVSGVANVPSYVYIAQGATSGTVMVTTNRVASPTSVTITGILNASSASQVLQVTQ